jgi:type IV secretion system protein VirB10
MSGREDVEATPAAKQDPETLVLRGRPRHAIRLRKSVILGAGGMLAFAVAGLAFTALRPHALRSAFAGEEARVGSAAPPEALAGAPRSYGDVPRLGPPLPGDLGRPILERRRQLEAESGQGASDPGADDPAAAADQRALAEEQSARSSALLVQRAAGTGQPSTADVADETGAAAQGPAPVGRQTVGGAFVMDSAGAPAGMRIPPPAGPLLAAGTILPASLMTGLNSDIPGMVIAQVTENVRDSATGTFVLIPQGARLFGTYDSRTAYAQKRALLVWDRLVFPDGSSVELGKMPATDASGYSGLRDRVDGHGWEVVKGVVLASLLGVGTEIAGDGGEPLERAVREALQENGSRAGEQIVGRGLDVRPTLKVRPGWPVRVLVARDLMLPPWKAAPWPR